MKKLALTAVLGASLMISSSAFALTSMTADGMKAATGQAGVSIAIDNVLIETYTASTKYTDEDGLTNVVDPANAGSVVISDKHTVKNFKALTSHTDFATDFNNAITADVTVKTTAATWAAGHGSHALSIDVGKCAALSLGNSENAKLANPAAPEITVAGVVIGLPTLLIATSADTSSVGVEMTGAANSGRKFITITKGESVTAILGGTIEIAPH